MNPTRQQQAVIDRRVGKGEILLVNAYAGSGKTTTLELVTRARARARFLYLCFNRDNAALARRSFPRNCECRTAHSLAWQAVGRQHPKIEPLRPRTVMEQFGLSAPYFAVYAINTLNAFLHSADPELSARHIDVAPDARPHDRSAHRRPDLAAHARSQGRGPPHQPRRLSQAVGAPISGDQRL